MLLKPCRIIQPVGYFYKILLHQPDQKYHTLYRSGNHHPSARGLSVAARLKTWSVGTVLWLVNYLPLQLVGGAITILKNISQWEGFSHILWKKVWNHQPLQALLLVKSLKSYLPPRNLTKLQETTWGENTKTKERYLDISCHIQFQAGFT